MPAPLQPPEMIERIARIIDPVTWQQLDATPDPGRPLGGAVPHRGMSVPEGGTQSYAKERYDRLVQQRSGSIAKAGAILQELAHATPEMRAVAGFDLAAFERTLKAAAC